MNIQFKLIFWWFLFMSTLGMSYSIIFDACHSWGQDGPKMVALRLLSEFFLTALSLRKLKKFAADCPSRWKERSQCSLSDMLSIVLYFGCALFFFRSIDPK